MKRTLIFLITVILPYPVFATDEFSCFGDFYSVSFIVSHSPENIEEVAEVHLRQKGEMFGKPLHDYNFTSNELVWIAREGDYSANSLNITLKHKSNNEHISVKATGTKGKLFYNGQSYDLQCEWEG